MDEKYIVKSILEADSDITIISHADGISYFELFGSEYGIRYFPEKERTKFPAIVVRNYDKYDLPHIMTFELTINDDICRCICLYEDEKIVKYLYSYEEKIIETLRRLKALLQLTEREIETEFQKEFLHYWNGEAETEVDVYLNKERCFQRLNLYQDKKEGIYFRFVSSSIKLNNVKAYRHIANVEGFYVPIIDNRRIFPPVKGKAWTMREVMDIIDGKPYSRISRDTFDKILIEKSKAAKILLIFEMIVEQQSYNFGLLVEFCNQTKDNLMSRLKKCVQKITPCVVNRCDYYFLNKLIGNDTSFIDKKVAVVGCGSLGSYVAEDLVKVGVKNLFLYDSDRVTYANILRHKAILEWEGYHKVGYMKSRLEAIHPEIFVEIKGNMLADTLKDDIKKYDLIIFTVGSSDVQLALNRVFIEEGYNKLVIYVWLEAGGKDSHILIVDYSKKGCFECLFTDSSGKLVNNKVNKLSDERIERYTLKNGCGATRVAYGTSVLLRTTSVLLDIIQKIFNNEVNENSLINISPIKVVNNGNSFVERECKCCGNRNETKMHQDDPS